MKILLLVFWFISIIIQAPSKFENFVFKLERTIDKNKVNTIISEFLASQNNKTFPIIEGNEVYFIYKGKANSVHLLGDMQYWTNETIEMINISNTDLFYKKLIFESDAKIDYLFKVDNNNSIKDPYNPHVQSGAFGVNSVLKMPSYYCLIDHLDTNGINKHKQIDTVISDYKQNIDYFTTILIPHNYDSRHKYRVAYFNAGKDYLKYADAKLTIEKLTYYGLIEPIIAVFIEPNDFINDYTGGNRVNYCSFLAEIVVPLIDKKYNTYPDSNNRLLIGDSYGGNITALTAYKHNNVFRRCALQSPDLSPNNYEVFNLFNKIKNKQFDFLVVAGTYETSIDSINSFVNKISKHNIPHKYLTFPQGHSWGLWKQTLSDILINYFSTNNQSKVKI